MDDAFGFASRQSQTASHSQSPCDDAIIIFTQRALDLDVKSHVNGIEQKPNHEWIYRENIVFLKRVPKKNKQMMVINSQILICFCGTIRTMSL